MRQNTQIKGNPNRQKTGKGTQRKQITKAIGIKGDRINRSLELNEAKCTGIENPNRQKS